MKLFYQLLVNTSLASITNSTVWFALTYFVYLQTRSVIPTSIISGIFLVSMAISGFWFGGLVDHNKKKPLMLASSLVSLCIYAIGFVIYLTAAPDAFSRLNSPLLWFFIPFLLIGVIAGNIRNISLMTLVTVLVPADRRDKANGIVGTAFGISFLIVSVISGFLVAHSGMFAVFILALIVSVVSIIHLLLIPIPEKKIAHTKEGHSKLDIPGTIKIIGSIPGLFPLILFTTVNNFLGGVFMSLMDAYGLSLVSVEVWGVIWGALSLGFIVGGILIAKFGLGKNPLRALFLANCVIWTVSIFFTIQPSIILLTVGMFIYLSVIPYIEAAEQTIVQKVVPHERQGRVFGFSQSVEQAASPVTAFVIGPLTQLVFIPFMTDGVGAQTIGSWFGTGPSRGIALVFTVTGMIGLALTLFAMRTTAYKLLSKQYLKK